MHDGRRRFGWLGRRCVTAVVGIALALAASAGAGNAQVEIKARAMEIKLTGRLQSQLITTSLDTGEVITSDFLIRRARISAEVRINDFVSGKVQPDFAGGDLTLKDAYVKLDFDPGFVVTRGQFKRPFDLFELSSSTQILVIERDGFVPGVDLCSGVGEICSFSRFTEKLEYADRDIGFLISGEPTGAPLAYSVSVTNGAGSDTGDENDGKSFSGRFAVEPMEDLTVAGNVGIHDFVNDSTGDNTDYAVAFGGDIEWGDYGGGLHVQAGIVAGDNWKALQADGDPSKFVTAQSIVGYRAPVTGNRFIEGV